MAGRLECLNCVNVSYAWLTSMLKWRPLGKTLGQWESRLSISFAEFNFYWTVLILISKIIVNRWINGSSETLSPNGHIPTARKLKVNEMRSPPRKPNQVQRLNPSLGPLRARPALSKPKRAQLERSTKDGERTTPGLCKYLKHNWCRIYLEFGR